MPQDEDLLPTLVDQAPLVTSTDIARTDPESKITDADLSLANNQLQFIAAAWSQVQTIGGICRLVDATIKATKHRRDILELPYGPRNKGEKDRTVFPLD